MARFTLYMILVLVLLSAVMATVGMDGRWGGAG